MAALRKEDARYTYADYCMLDDGKRYEIIDGELHAMSPAPSWRHQEISSNLHGQLHVFLKNKKCKVFAAPFDVRLSADEKDDTVVQPDLVVICDHSKLSGTGCIGAPDLVIEILSPSTLRLDRADKLLLYQRTGVQEYWIADPEAKTVHAHILEGGRYFVSCYANPDSAPVSVLKGCTINLSEVFAE